MTGAAARGLRRLWPDTVAARIAVILMLALFAFLALSMLAYVRDRADATLHLFAHSVADRIVATVRLMEEVPAAGRGRLLASIDSPTLGVALSPDRPSFPPSEPGVEGFVRRHLAPLLAGRELLVSIPEARPWRRAGRRGEAGPDLLPSRRKAVIAVGLGDGSWAVFTAATELTSLRWAARMAAWLVVGGLFVVLFAAWVSRRVTRPVRRFSDAADRIGRDLFAAPPLPETGSPELRRAAHAFNRMQDRLRRLVEDRTLMLAAISHDLRTALTRLRLRIEFIGDGTQRARAEGDVAEMQAMLEATLAFARDEAVEEAHRPVDLASLAQTLCDNAADAGGVARYDGPDRLVLTCPPAAIRRALANLIDNAIAYGGEATVGLAEDERAVRIVVADRGPGIPEAQRELVFQPFRRLETSRSRETGGTGLGLSIARGAVRRCGGDIALGDRPGGGLEAVVTLPKPDAGR
ncbi:MAG: ATP-binding protein [Defluviicoccus sp.]|nr:ATP-binding protein [Defluviicoccus sp.]